MDRHLPRLARGLAHRQQERLTQKCSEQDPLRGQESPSSLSGSDSRSPGDVFHFCRDSGAPEPDRACQGVVKVEGETSCAIGGAQCHGNAGPLVQKAGRNKKQVFSFPLQSASPPALMCFVSVTLPWQEGRSGQVEALVSAWGPTL